MTPAAWTSFKIRALDLAEIIDAHRVFPKFFVVGYGTLGWHVAMWFEGLREPSAQQMAFVTIVVSVFAPIVNWYMQGGRSWDGPPH